jgi:hypothetical protein
MAIDIGVTNDGEYLGHIVDIYDKLGEVVVRAE